MKSIDHNRADRKVPRNSNSPGPVQEQLQYGAVMQAAASFQSAGLQTQLDCAALSPEGNGCKGWDWKPGVGEGS